MAPAVAPQERVAARAGRARWLVVGGTAAFAVALAGYLAKLVILPMRDWMKPVDLRVYRFGGMIAAHVRPLYNPRLASPLYDWPGFAHLRFTYPPFAAMIFTVLRVPPLKVLFGVSIVVGILAFLATIWVTLGGLGYRAGAVKAGATLLVAGATFWTEPVQRTLFLGQVELVLMALVMWDMCQPDGRRLKGIGVGIAAGIKLVPLIFIPYLLLTRRFRQAAVASATFAVTVGLGFAVLPADSSAWWLHGVFAQGARTGFTGWEGNQSLLAIITRLAGSTAGAQPAWLAAAALAVILGLGSAALAHRAGQPMLGLLTCALTGLLVSPISWDHHWVWIVPGVAVLAGYALRARGALRWSCVGLAAAVTLVFGAWPTSLWGENKGLFSLGLFWEPPDSNPITFYRIGDQPWYAEYHWHGIQLIAGNLYVLTGLAAFALLVALACRIALTARPPRRPSPVTRGSSPVTRGSSR